MIDINSMLEGKERVRHGLPYNEKRESCIGEKITKTPLPPCEICGRNDACECRIKALGKIMVEDYLNNIRKNNWEEWIANHIKECPTCKASFEEMEGGMCEVAFKKFQEILKENE